MVDFAKHLKAGKTVISQSVEKVREGCVPIEGEPGVEIPGEPSPAEPKIEETSREPRAFIDGDYSKVTLKLGVTKALGDYEFARVDVEIQDFCEPTRVARKRCFEEIKLEASGLLGGVVKEISRIKRRGTSSG